MATEPQKPGNLPDITTFGAETPARPPSGMDSVAFSVRNSEAIIKENPSILIPEIRDIIFERTGTLPSVTYNADKAAYILRLPQSAMENDALASIGISKEEIDKYWDKTLPVDTDDPEFDIALVIPCVRMRSVLDNEDNITPTAPPAQAASHAAKAPQGTTTPQGVAASKPSGPAHKA